MSPPKFVTLDGNEAVARVAYAANEVIAIYPITPATPIGEACDAWAARGKPNLFGGPPQVIEMQSEGGAVAAVHGALQGGALSATFTASQGLLLMIPSMFKIAGELTPTVFHVAARSVATHALSIFGDHSDVMTVRSTGWCMLASCSVQEAHDFALIAQAATLRSRVPVLHFFDGFRTSHEINKIESLPDDTIREMIDQQLIHEHRARCMDPNRPVLRGTAQNPDVFFQAREAANPKYLAVPSVIREEMQRFAVLTGREYGLFEYEGDPDAERVIVLMGSGAGAVSEAIVRLRERGEKVGLVKVRLYRPFDTEAFFSALPATARRIAVLDRTKEPGSVGEPLYLDVVASIGERAGRGAYDGAPPLVIGGRYGLSSKEFTPAMAAGVFEELRAEEPKQRFTIGIHDDVTNLSVSWDDEFAGEDEDVLRGVFYGLGSDGTVGACKSTVKIVGENTPQYSQGYFVYDSKKAGSVTQSHLRFSPRPIQSTYLIQKAHFVGCHQFSFLEKMDVLGVAAPGATFLLNCPHPPEEVWDRLPREVQQAILEKGLKFYVVDAVRVAREAGMGGRINTVMQTCFFTLSGLLPKDEAIEQIKKAITKTYGAKGESILNRNFAAVDGALASMAAVTPSQELTSDLRRQGLPQSPNGSDFIDRVTSVLMAGLGDSLPVSALPIDGTYPTGTASLEKRSIAAEIPIWEPDICIDCGLCALVCPHAAIRTMAYPEAVLDDAPEDFATKPYRNKDYPDHKLTVQVAPDDCTGCGVCVDVCPARNKAVAKEKAINMRPKQNHLELERRRFDYFRQIQPVERTRVATNTVKGSQLLLPLFEFSGACAGCGETPYLKLLSQLFGDRAVIGNATGCSSIYGGNLPTTPWTTNGEGRGPTWNNSLFEDAAEFGLGLRLADDAKRVHAESLLKRVSAELGDDGLVDPLVDAEQLTEEQFAEQRRRVELLRERLRGVDTPEARELETLADSLVRRSTWIIGGDGWAYDIGFGGLDHVLTTGRNVNILVVDTGVLLEHRRTSVEVHAPRSGREVRHRRQGLPPERPRHARGLLRLRLRGPGRDGRQPHTNNQGLPRSRVVPRSVSHPRLQPLRSAWDRHDEVLLAPEGHCPVGLLAPLSLRPARGPRRWPPVPARQPRPPQELQGGRHARGTLRDARPCGPRERVPPDPTGAGRHQRSMALLRADGRNRERVHGIITAIPITRWAHR